MEPISLYCRRSEGQIQPAVAGRALLQLPGMGGPSPIQMSPAAKRLPSMTSGSHINANGVENLTPKPDSDGFSIT
jgi:hypothetical protein